MPTNSRFSKRARLRLGRRACVFLQLVPGAACASGLEVCNLCGLSVCPFFKQNALNGDLGGACQLCSPVLERRDAARHAAGDHHLPRPARQARLRLHVRPMRRLCAPRRRARAGPRVLHQGALHALPDDAAGDGAHGDRPDQARPGRRAVRARRGGGGGVLRPARAVLALAPVPRGRLSQRDALARAAAKLLLHLHGICGSARLARDGNAPRNVARTLPAASTAGAASSTGVAAAASSSPRPAAATKGFVGHVPDHRRRRAARALHEDRAPRVSPLPVAHGAGSVRRHGMSRALRRAALLCAAQLQPPPPKTWTKCASRWCSSRRCASGCG